MRSSSLVGSSPAFAGAQGQRSAGAALDNDLDRDVYCIAGMPIDVIDIGEAVRRIDAATRTRQPFLLSTPNVNFLVNSWKSAEFRDSLIMSDLCAADGMPIVWVARLMGLPIGGRTSGADIFDALKVRRLGRDALKLFWFGGTEANAAAAARGLNRSGGGVSCVGWQCPGFGSLEEICQQTVAERINASNADLVVAALGAHNGQLWLSRNHSRLRAPVRVHLGAVINFEAGAIRRAPKALRNCGLEWLWRIKEEPRLLSRYWRDGLALLALLATKVLPLAASELSLRIAARRHRLPFAISSFLGDDDARIGISGYATAADLREARDCFRAAADSGRCVTVDLARVHALDSRFFGLLLMLQKRLRSRGCVLRITSASPRVKNLFRLNGLEALLS